MQGIKAQDICESPDKYVPNFDRWLSKMEEGDNGGWTKECDN